MPYMTQTSAFRTKTQLLSSIRSLTFTASGDPLKQARREFKVLKGSHLMKIVTVDEIAEAINTNTTIPTAYADEFISLARADRMVGSLVSFL